MNKKYLIIFAVTIVAAVGFFVFKNQINEKDLRTHTNQQYNRMIELSSKSPMAGLSHMGRALNKYKQDTGSYPEKLSALYPDYIPVKAFIDEIQWSYKPGGNNFYLSKTCQTKNNQVLTAAIGADLKLQRDSMVASIDKPKQTPAPIATKPAAKKPRSGITLASEKNAGPTVETATTGPYSNRRQTAGTESGIPQKPLSPEIKSPHERELVSMEQISEEEQFVKRIKGNFLVWKKEDGTLGFGNVQYPNSEEMTIYDKGEWIQIRHRSPNSYAETETLQARADNATTADRLVAAYSNNFLTWKNPEGTICYGNVQYPHNQDIQIHVAGRWQAAKN